MELIQEVMQFIDDSPCNYLAVNNISRQLEEKGYHRLYEHETWNMEKGEKYYVVRNDSALIAFRMPEHIEEFLITASHSDSPCFKIKENPQIKVQGKYTKLSVETYGGMIMSSWLDRPLSIAGRVLVKQSEAQGMMDRRLICIDRDLLIIPNQAIHMNREMNNGYAYKKHIDLVPLWGGNLEDNAFRKLLAEELHVPEEDIIDYDLTVYNRMKCSRIGAQQEFLAGPRLDDLESAYVTFKAFLEAEKMKEGVTPVFCLYDNEEVGSLSMQGAASTFLKDVLKRIVSAYGGTKEDYRKVIANSFMISADNAHGVHPNFAENSDANNRCYINDGVALKYQTSQKYASDSVSAALFRQLADAAEAKVQTYMNRSDQPGGSTLGNISTAQVPLRTVDVGLPQLAMHSSYETAGAYDAEELYKITKKMYESKLVIKQSQIGFTGK